MRRTPNAINGATNRCDSKKKRCKTKSADGAFDTFRLVIQMKKGPAKMNPIAVNQKYQRRVRNDSSAPAQIKIPLNRPNEPKKAARRGHGGPPL